MIIAHPLAVYISVVVFFRQSKLFYREGIIYLNHLYHLKTKNDVAAVFRVTVDPETQETQLFKTSSFHFTAKSKATQIGDCATTFFVDDDGCPCFVDQSIKPFKQIVRMCTKLVVFRQSNLGSLYSC